MAVYEYVCRECGRRFQLVHSMSEHETKKRVSCPKCKSLKVDRVWSIVNVVTSKKS